MDLVGSIIAYEEGQLDDTGTVELFADLIKSGQAWSLQGHYGRVATMLIERGIVSPQGEVDWDMFAEVV